MRQATLIDPRGVHWSIAVPQSRRERARGLRRSVALSPGRGMLFQRCRSVHTFGMRFEIDVAFLDARGRVLMVKRGPPRRLLVHRHARAVLECVKGSGLRTGDLLQPLFA